VGAVEEQVVESIERSQKAVIDLVPKQRLPRVGMAEVRAALERARALVQGDVLLTSEDPELELKVTASELKRALQIQAASVRGHVRLALGFSEQVVNRLLAPIVTRGLLEPRDAMFYVDSADQVTIVPGRDGRVLRPGAVAAALREAALTAERTGQLPLAPGPLPKLTTRAATELKIHGLVAKFATRHPCCRPRVKNIHRIAEILDSVIVLPGQTLSVNEVVGPRTEANGFVAAPSIEDGEMVDTVGGGISQFATTLFNAVLHGGYEIIERQPHTYYFNRYPMGHEATLSWPKPDLVFRNDTRAGLLIKTFAAAKSITVKLYGDNGGRRIHTHVSAPSDVVQPPVELVGNPKLGIDRERVVDHGRIGWSVIATRRIVLQDGTKREQKRRVTYQPETRIVEVHPCRIPEGEPGYTGKPCPVPEDENLGAAGASGQGL
jgi:vancomycin resistance protein YoaR